MTGLIPLAIPINAETLLAQAQAARVGAHIRTMLSRLKARMQKPAQIAGIGEGDLVEPDRN
jgi:hypothetical protein